MPPDTSPARGPRVLVTGTGGPAGLAVMKAIGRERFDIFSADMDPYAAGLYLVARDRRLLLPAGAAARFADSVVAFCRRARIDVVVPTVDSELLPLAMRREELAAGGCALVLASVETLRICLDKWILHQRCAGVLRVPTSVLVDATFDAAGLALPVIVKPRVGSGSRGVRLVGRREDLEQLPRDGSLLVQEHLPGIEHSLDVLARSDGKVVAVVPRARLKVDSGIAVTVGRSVTNAWTRSLARWPGASA